VVVMKSMNFWDIMPCSLLRVNRRFGGTYRLLALLATCFHAGFLLNFFFTLKMEAMCSSETSVDSRRTTQRYIPEDGTLYYKLLFDLVTLYPISYAIIGFQLIFNSPSIMQCILVNNGSSNFISCSFESR
jgi:hypothetical protein